MSEKSNEDEVTSRAKEAKGGNRRDSQADGVADTTARQGGRAGAQHAPDTPTLAQPSTNREAVPGGLEGSIMFDEDEAGAEQADGGEQTADKPAGSERRVDDL
jgi:hypothetical protein